MTLIRPLVAVIVSITLCFGFETYDEFKADLDRSLLWGAYRPETFFGVRPRNIDESPFIMGLMWFDSLSLNSPNMNRHFVERYNSVTHYGWKTYDPRIGGVEEIIDNDNNLNLTITFMKSRDGLNWIARISGKKLDQDVPTAASMVIYLDQQISETNDKDRLNLVKDRSINNLTFDGYSSELGKYKVLVKDLHGGYYNRGAPNRPYKRGIDASRTRGFSMYVPGDNYWKAHLYLSNIFDDTIRYIRRLMMSAKTPEEREANGFERVDYPDVLMVSNFHDFDEGNFHFVQKTFDLVEHDTTFEFDVIFNSDNSTEKITSETASALITAGLNELDTKFNKKFKIPEKEKNKTEFVKAALSDLLGGIGYFYGTQVVDRETVFDETQFEEIKLDYAKQEGPLRLFTAVPSRAQFPRGFYWDEGFHVLQIMEYDSDLAFEIIRSWFDLIDDKSGWIPREVILGDSARSRVPDEFTTQSPNIANPPTLLFAFGEMVKRASDNFETESINEDDLPHDTLETNKDFLIEYSKKIYPKLVKHYNWFLKSQNLQTDDDYNEIFDELDVAAKIHQDNFYAWKGRTFKHCLPSGLDDYPRAQPPTTSELHVDAISWVGIMARSMKQIATILGEEEDAKNYEKTEQNVIDNILNVHWSEKDKCFCDVTLDDMGENLVYVCHEGYISLIPFALKLLPKDSEKLDDILKLMSDPKKLFSPYGLLSLSKQDEYFGKDENYWRGPIWMNINYLCLDSIRYYFPQSYLGKSSELKSTRPGKVVDMAVKLYQKLKTNLITNVFNEWEKQGYCYENYNAETGEGSGTMQFTGWTALIVNIIGKF